MGQILRCLKFELMLSTRASSSTRPIFRLQRDGSSSRAKDLPQPSFLGHQFSQFFSVAGFSSLDRVMFVGFGPVFLKINLFLFQFSFFHHGFLWFFFFFCSFTSFLRSFLFLLVLFCSFIFFVLFLLSVFIVFFLLFLFSSFFFCFLRFFFGFHLFSLFFCFITGFHCFHSLALVLLLFFLSFSVYSFSFRIQQEQFLYTFSIF